MTRSILAGVGERSALPAPSSVEPGLAHTSLLAARHGDVAHQYDRSPSKRRSALVGAAPWQYALHPDHSVRRIEFHDRPPVAHAEPIRTLAALEPHQPAATRPLASESLQLDDNPLRIGGSRRRRSLRALFAYSRRGIAALTRSRTRA